MKTTDRKPVLILKFPYSSTYGGGEKHTIDLVEKLHHYDFFLLSTCSVLVSEFSKRNWHVRTTWAGVEPVTPKSLVLFLLIWPAILLNLLIHLLVYRFKHNVRTIFCLSLTEKVLLTPWAKLLGMKVIWMEHTMIERWLLSSPLRIPFVLWSRFATTVSVAEAIRSKLLSIGVRKSDTKVIYNSINIKEFTPAPSDPDTIHEQFDILYVGRLSDEKGVDDLIHAVGTIVEDMPQAHLTIVGEGDIQPDLEAIVHKLDIENKVEFVGFQRNVAEWMRRSDVVVLPSNRKESFGIVVIEALASMKPVIATTVGGISEAVGRYGYMVAPNSPEQQATALREIFNNYTVALDKAGKGRIHVIELFQESRMLNEFEQLFS